MTDRLGFAREVIFRQLFNKYGRPLLGTRIIRKHPSYLLGFGGDFLSCSMT